MGLNGITYYRSAAFHKDKNGKALHFWTIDPVHDKPGLYYIREHEAGLSHRYSARMTGDLTEREALHKIEELEKRAETTMQPIDAKNDALLKRMGDAFTEAIPWQDHPVHIAEARQAQLNRGKNNKFRLKP